MSFLLGSPKFCDLHQNCDVSCDLKRCKYNIKEYDEHMRGKVNMRQSKYGENYLKMVNSDNDEQSRRKVDIRPQGFKTFTCSAQISMNFNLSLKLK